jgi:uncharacterized protein YcbK (DUF882 family)
MTEKGALERERYKEWLLSRGVKYNFHEEIANLANNVVMGVENDTPPVWKWHKILPTIRLVELVREQFGPTTINSAYRSLIYNSVLPGSAKDSRHNHNDALDFRCKSGTPKDWYDFLMSMRNEGKFTGGLGLYKTFVHVDTRGVNATWKGS